MQAFLLKVVLGLLEHLLGKAVTAAKDAAAQHELDKQRGETNAENAKKYQEASDRQAKIKAALDLLNRTPRN